MDIITNVIGTGSVIFILAIIILTGIFAFMGIKKVNESHVMIVERLGKFHKQLGPGINFIIPGLDRIKTNINLYTTNVKYNKEHTEIIVEGGERDVARTRTYEQVNLAPNGQINMAEHLLDPPELDAITSDNAIVHPDLIMYFLIVEPQKAVYNVANLNNSMMELLNTLLRQEVGKLDSDAILTSRETIGIACKEYLEKACEPWGIRVTRVEIQAIEFSRELQVKLTAAREAELSRRAEVIAAKEVRDKEILEAEGKKQAEILTAEGSKQSIILAAEAKKQQQVLVAEGKFENDKLDAEGKFLLSSREEEGKAKGVAAMAAALQKNPEGIVALKALEAQMKVAEHIGSSNNSIIIPSETAGFFGAIGSVKHVLSMLKDRESKTSVMKESASVDETT